MLAVLFESWSMTLSASMLLAVMATLGYVVGRRRPTLSLKARDNSRAEIDRALAVAHELESVAQRLNSSLAAHVPAILKFSSRLKRLERADDASWHELCDGADELLKPALRLSTEISHAYAEILQQMTHLATFAELRTDPLTGVSNRRAFDDTLESLARQPQEEAPFSLAVLDIDFFKLVNDEQGHLNGDRALQDLAQHLQANLREEDVLARYGGEEFAVLMPRTDLATACNVCERLRAGVAADLPITISIGLAKWRDGDTAINLLARADAALYTAKGAGRNCVQFHEGPPGRIVGIKVSSADQTTKQTPNVPRSATPPLAILADSVEPTQSLHLQSEAC